MDYPQQGSIIFIDSEPHAGHEIGGHDSRSGNIRRPMIVLSSTKYNQKTGFVCGMLITSRDRSGAPEHLYSKILDMSSGVKGTIIKWYLPSYDYRARHGQVVGKVSWRMLKELLMSARDIYEM
ncbi:type II toxin-antitoxin system PemK/MazF family toxin [Companilactobacillus ginsenosidimutans]|uniref:Cell division protein n=1 Tax=Companilactobacillus ginsenosidimutans TaxID=1007676 RepID=A0A0H4QKR2_9LACO|nr:type II toxin-antitoxin system PemK/MazF family toxin [Companilactobacillus ginsenosidimutans]AKP67686.1 hypothetical protein ABM34_09205 [Companilactobacillus ginsenosidimutans]